MLQNPESPLETKKSSEELLKEILPLPWKEAFQFAKKKGFDNPEGVKKRIDLAKKYNLEIEHFFYDPKKIEEEMPTKEQIKKTAEELMYVNKFTKDLSKNSQTPIFCIFNARCGTIYSYGIDILQTQLNLQFEDLARKETKSIQNLRDEFVKDLKSNKYWRQSKKLSLMDVTDNWILKGRISYFLCSTVNTKISSRIPSGHQVTRNSIHKLLSHIDQDTDAVMNKGYNILFIDTTTRPLEQRETPNSFNIMPKLLDDVNKEYSKLDIKDRTFSFKKDAYSVFTEMRKKQIFSLCASHSREKGLSFMFDPTSYSVWWDNMPQIFGKISKKFGYGHRGMPEIPTEQIVQSAQKVEYLSEKIKNALRFYERDEEDKNWFERNFEGGILSRKNTPKKGSKEYLNLFRKWVPYKTDEKGEAILDDKGYPIPHENNIMALAAEDELNRLESAIEELKEI